MVYIASREYDSMTKIILIGPRGAGKTALSMRLAKDEYVENYIQANSSQCLSKELIEIETGSTQLFFWDICFEPNTMDIYLQHADFVLCLFSLADKNTFNVLKSKILLNESLNLTYNNQKPIYILIGTHSDRPIDISQQELNELTSQFKTMKYFAVSSSSRKGIDNLFSYLKEKIINSLENKSFSRQALNSNIFRSQKTLRQEQRQKETEECAHLWNASLSELKNIRNVLNDYSLKNNAWQLWFSFHANRHNTWHVAHIVQQIDQEKLQDPKEVLAALNDIEQRNGANNVKDGAFNLRLGFIKFKLGMIAEEEAIEQSSISRL